MFQFRLREQAEVGRIDPVSHRPDVRSVVVPVRSNHSLPVALTISVTISELCCGFLLLKLVSLS